MSDYINEQDRASLDDRKVTDLYHSLLADSLKANDIIIEQSTEMLAKLGHVLMIYLHEGERKLAFYRGDQARYGEEYFGGMDDHPEGGAAFEERWQDLTLLEAVRKEFYSRNVGLGAALSDVVARLASEQQIWPGHAPDGIAKVLTSDRKSQPNDGQ